jgi:hypothetical protein
MAGSIKQYIHTGAGGTGDFIRPEITKEQTEREIKEIEAEEKHIGRVMLFLERVTEGKKPKDLDVSSQSFSEKAKQVIFGLDKIKGAISELKFMKDLKNADKAINEYMSYYLYWEKVAKDNKLPGGLFNKLKKYNNLTIKHVLESIAKHIGKTEGELKDLLKEAHRRYKQTHLEFKKQKF